MTKRKKSERRGAGASSYSSLQDHVRAGKSLIPKLRTLPQLVLTSWIQERLPEVLWAALIVTHRPRGQALDIIRQVLAFVRDGAVALDRPLDVTLSGLEGWDWSLRSDFIEKLVQLAPDAVVPLLLFDDLPSRELWESSLKARPSEVHWQKVAEAVAAVLDHQSQEATDCRWARLVFQVVIGRMQFVGKMGAVGEEIFYYPDKGDQRQVRPTVRAGEGGMDALHERTKNEWPVKLWTQCLRDTKCIIGPDAPAAPVSVGTTLVRLRLVRERLRVHCGDTRATSAVDPKHDTVFASALFSLALLEELLGPGVGRSLMGRMTVRSLAEVYVNLSYLLKRDDAELWQSFRVFGAGQAKLSFLHLERLGEASYVDLAQLEALANEDLWLEYLTVNLGHWSSKNARALAEEAGVKDVYERYYPWSSGYIHGHWSAMRDSVLTTCFNPLHRLHRVPRARARSLEDVVPDAVWLVDSILARVEEAYPPFRHRLSIGGDIGTL